MKPQTADVLALLRRRPEGVTPLEALVAASTFRLGARVYELRQMGYDIERQWAENHEGARYARYVLHEEPVTLADPVRRHVLEQEMELGLT